jgi:chromosome segregation ATPase
METVIEAMNRRDEMLRRLHAELADKKKWISDLEREYGLTTKALRAELAAKDARIAAFREALAAAEDREEELIEARNEERISAESAVLALEAANARIVELEERCEILEAELRVTKQLAIQHVAAGRDN